MTKSTITRERIQRIIRAINSEAYDEEEIREWLSSDEIMELSRMALAAMDSESGCLPLDYLQGHKDGLEWAAQLAEANHPETGDWLYDDPIDLAKAIRKGPDMPPAQPVADSEPVIVVGDDGGDALSYRRLIQSFEPGTKLYRHAQPAAEREQVRSAHAEWSQATFGNVGPVGPLKHLSKEALEAAAEPGDLSEWADMQFLLWDAQRRAGITDEQITQAMIEKLAVNKQRKWPEPKDGEPRLHIKEQPAPVVSADLLHTAASAIEDLLTTKDRTGAGVWFDLPFRLRSAANAQSPGSDPATVPGKWIPVSERMPDDNSDVLCTAEFDGPGDWRRKVGYWHEGKWVVYGASWTPTHWMELPAAPQEVKGE